MSDKNCGSSCSSCPSGSTCSSKKTPPKSFQVSPNELSSIKKVVAVMSGKGGVGKSMITTLLAVLAKRRNMKIAILDADITGPSIPKMLGVHQKIVGNDRGMFPSMSKSGIKVMSINLLLPNDTDPVVWRGPVIDGTIKQFWSGVIWDDIDIMFIDMPPGTGDVPLTVFQALPVDGVVLVTTPQELVGMIVEKALKMTKMVNKKVLGIVENMSYIECPCCKEKINLFSESSIASFAQKFDINTFAKLPIDSRLARAADCGEIENFEGTWLDSLLDNIESKLFLE